jgi:hypothetical protein
MRRCSPLRGRLMSGLLTLCPPQTPSRLVAGAQQAPERDVSGLQRLGVRRQRIDPRKFLQVRASTTLLVRVRLIRQSPSHGPGATELFPKGLRIYWAVPNNRFRD